MSYTYSQLRTDVNNRLHAKLGRITSVRDAINVAVKKGLTLPFKTLKRRYSSPIRLVDGIDGYTCPSDILGSKVIDLKPVTEARSFDYQWNNVPSEAFDRLRSSGKNVLSVTSNGPSRLLLASVDGNDEVVTLSTLDTVTAGGAWAAVGTASNLTTDPTTYLYGTGSVKFDIGAGTQDGISTTLTTTADISDYTADGSIYLAASLPDVTAITGVTVRLGSDASNYVQCSVTSDIYGNALTDGFNQLRLNLSSGTVTGSPDYAAVDYVALLVDKSATAVTGVRFDNLVVGVGSQYFLDYYSRFMWRSAAGTWKADSTLDTDILNAEEEEYQILLEACVEELGQSAREYQDADRAAIKLKGLVEAYSLAHPDDSIPETADCGIEPII